jgi:beta-glucosidase
MPSTENQSQISPVEERINSLIKEMTLEEKIGQMTQVEKNSISPEEVRNFFIGSVLSGGGGFPSINTPVAWADMVDTYQKCAMETRMAIPLIYGVDAVHGHSNMNGAVIFPHNIGLGASRNPNLVFQIGRATTEELVATGIYWNFAPTIAVPQDIRWGRTYEGYSENTQVVSNLGAAYIRGLQGDKLDTDHFVLATPKHFLGDGGTTWGSSSFRNNQLDQGDTQIDEETLRKIHLSPYLSAIQNGAMCIMASFSSWNGRRMTANNYLLTDVLKEELGFTGFIVSDWQAVDQLSDDYYQAVSMAVNAGIDMTMVPYDYKKYIYTLMSVVQQGDVTESRINDAVYRILHVKLMLGLFDRPYAQRVFLSHVGSESHRLLARQAVSESLVLLKNDNQILPISKDVKLILVAGRGADNIGIQCGGWTIEWKGIDGNQIPGTTILQGLKNITSQDTRIVYEPSGIFDITSEAKRNPALADIGIVVVGEIPYAEGDGDSEDLCLSQNDVELIHQMRSICHRLVVILISGRPMIITDQLPLINALVCAWLPGQEGEGIADVLFGDKEFKGRLPYTWPKSMDQIPFNFENLPTGDKSPLFPFGYGLEAN